MISAKLQLLAATLGRGEAKLNLPYSIDFTALADGPLPSEWLAPTWSISGSKAINVPTYTEIITNGDFTDWESGVPVGWTKGNFGGDASLTEDPTGQARMQATTSNVYIRQIKTSNSNFIHVSFDVTAIAAGQLAMDGLGITITTSTTGTKIQRLRRAASSEEATLRMVRWVLPLDVTFDNVSVKCLDSSVFALLPASSKDVIVKAVPAGAPDGNFYGVIARADSRTNPQNYLLFIASATSSPVTLFLYKCVNGVLTQLGVSYTADAYTELRCSGTSIKAYGGPFLKYDGVVDEPTINNNKYHGMFSWGGNSLDSFFLVEEPNVEEMTLDKSLIILGDLQTLAQSYPAKLTTIANSIIAKKESMKIEAVLQVGDLVEATDNTDQWAAIDGMFDDLDVENIPYLVAQGNHDGMDRETAVWFNGTFPVSRYTTKDWWSGGFMDASYSHNAYLIIGDYLYLTVEFGPRQVAVDWAKTIIAANPTKKVVIVTHCLEYNTGPRFLTTGDNFNPHIYYAEDTHDGQEIWDEMIYPYQNPILGFSGHVQGGSYHTATGLQGNKFLSSMFNQQNTSGANFRIAQFYGNLIYIRTYNPETEAWVADSRFWIRI